MPYAGYAAIVPDFFHGKVLPGFEKVQEFWANSRLTRCGSIRAFLCFSYLTDPFVYESL